MIRDILGLVIGGAFGVWILGFVVSGVRSGRIRHTNSTATFSFRHQPVRFALVALLFTLIGGFFLYAAFHRAISIWLKFSA